MAGKDYDASYYAKRSDRELRVLARAWSGSARRLESVGYKKAAEEDHRNVNLILDEMRKRGIKN